MRMSFPALSLLFAVLFQAPLDCRAEIPGVEALSDLIIEQFDSNRDGDIDTTEWNDGITNGFDEIDFGGDGVLTPEDFDKLSEPVSRHLGELTGGLVTVLIKKVILTLDGNDDGEVSRAEYSEKSGNLLTKLDQDKNFIVTRSELKQLPANLFAE